MDTEVPSGWPLGLGNMNIWLRVGDTSNAQGTTPPQPYPLHVQSPSFSSITSSNLDTESTASFFPDRSVSLGRLIGIRAGNRAPSLQLPGKLRVEESGSNGRSKQGEEMGCVPLLQNAMRKINRSKSSSKL